MNTRGKHYFKIRSYVTSNHTVSDHSNTDRETQDRADHTKQCEIANLRVEAEHINTISCISSHFGYLLRQLRIGVIDDGGSSFRNN